MNDIKHQAAAARLRADVMTAISRPAREQLEALMRVLLEQFKSGDCEEAALTREYEAALAVVAALGTMHRANDQTRKDLTTPEGAADEPGRVH